MILNSAVIKKIAIENSTFAFNLQTVLNSYQINSNHQGCYKVNRASNRVHKNHNKLCVLFSANFLGPKVYSFIKFFKKKKKIYPPTPYFFYKKVKFLL